MCDIWREIHRNKKQFSWHSLHEPVGSRLDRVYLPTQWILVVNKTQIQPFSWSDHDLVVTDFQLPKTYKREKGYWKLNETLLSDENYMNAFRTFWEGWKERKGDFDNPAEWWDIGKIEIKRLSIKHSVTKSRQNMKTEQNLRKQYEEEQNKPDLISKG